MNNSFGYAGKILNVDLSSRSITNMPTKMYSNKFIGGMGIAAKIYWDEVPPGIKAFDAENRLIFMTGPLAGFPGLSGSRWTVSGKSPLSFREQFSSVNLGGSWGAQLKSAGYDGLVIRGKSESPVYLFVQDDVVEIRDASSYWGKGAVEVREALKNDLGRTMRVVACGPSGENMVLFSNVLADEDASGSGGFGAVMGSKYLKAIAVHGSGKVVAADPDSLGQLKRKIINEASTIILPVLEVGVGLIANPVVQDFMNGNFHTTSKMKKQVCSGCMGIGCWRATYQADDGRKGKFMCGPSFFYEELAFRYYGERNDIPFQASMICNESGLDIFGIVMSMAWLLKCAEAGVLTDESTGIPISKVGSLEFIETLTKKISAREGFGDILADGLGRAAEIVGGGSREFLSDFQIQMSDKTPEFLGGDPRLFLPTAILLATGVRIDRSQYQQFIKPLGNWLAWLEKEKSGYVSSEVYRSISRKWWGSESAIDCSTCDGKALAAKIVQDRDSASSSLGFCSYTWPVFPVRNSEDHAGDPALEGNVYSAVTGVDADEEGLLRAGERIYNLARAIRIREGRKGKEDDTLPEQFFEIPLQINIHSRNCLVPGMGPERGGGAVSRKGAMLPRDMFQKMMDEYYFLRGWDVSTGLQTSTKLEDLGLGEVAKEFGTR